MSSTRRSRISGSLIRSSAPSRVRLRSTTPARRFPSQIAAISAHDGAGDVKDQALFHRNPAERAQTVSPARRRPTGILKNERRFAASPATLILSSRFTTFLHGAMAVARKFRTLQKS